ncbi:unnamed protein product [Anisakis simplex]|uniref:Uncharacterized protein n=1 Tax=Anisakis simplex TaxID=6269 RepID=A0A3P6S1I1_ANISI|nr:unnamed protein product [Anisakis simplex]
MIIASTIGRVWVLDPARVTECRQQFSCLLEQTLSAPIIDVCVDQFVSGTQQNFIAILFPHNLTIYRLVSENDCHELVVLHEHNVNGVAYNMCVGNFGHSTTSQICVQNINCSLSIFELEHHLFERNILSNLHPGPIIYAPQSDSIITASDSILSSTKFSTLAAASNTTHGKKLNPDWTFNLGEWPLDVSVIDTTPVQPSIVVLCKRSLLCFTHGGTLRFSIRLQCIATALLVYNSSERFTISFLSYLNVKIEFSASDAYIQLCIATTTKTLLFYADNILIWAAQLTDEPIQLNLCSFGTVYRSMLAILSERRLSISYLGTEPSLFRLPASQTRFIDFQERQIEFSNLETAIRKKPSDVFANCKSFTGVENRCGLRFECNFNGLDEKSMARDVNEETPSLTTDIMVSTETPLNDVRIMCRTQFFAEQKYFVIANIRYQPITDLRCQFLLFSASNALFAGELSTMQIKLPLALMCRATGTQRNVQYKLTFESSEASLEIGELFPEFEAERSTSIALQPILSDWIVSIFVSQKSRRYRIQSDSLDALYVFTDEFISRIKQKQENVILTCSPPIDHILQRLNLCAELERRRTNDEIELERASTQLRGAQASMLAKLKAPRPSSIAHLDSLMQYSHTQLLSYIERISRAEAALHTAALSFSCSLNLLHLLMMLNGKHLPIDGYIVDCSGQTVTERFKWILSTFVRLDINADITANELKILLRNQCENFITNTRMENIDEELEDEENENEKISEQNINPLVSGSIPFIRNTE